MIARTLHLAALFCLLPASGAAFAQDELATPDASTSLEARVQAEVRDAGSVFAMEAVAEATLRSTTGREDTSQVSQANLRAGVSNNSVGDNAVTGAAQIDGNAFQNMSGLSILNVNTGNNVAINAAMNVNISISPAP